MRIRALLTPLIRSSLVAGLMMAVLSMALGQSEGIEGMDFGPLIARSNAMVADNQADLPAYHVHYEIRVWDYRRKPSSATYDLYREGVAKTLRLSQRSGFSESMLTLGAKIWIKRSAITPLRFTELSEAFPRPAYAYIWAQTGNGQPRFNHRDRQGEPLVCGTTEEGLELCFDQATSLVASARIKDQTIRYKDWLPVGNRYVPGIIEMRLGERLLFSAQGRVDTLPMYAGLFTPQPGAWQMGGKDVIVRDSSTEAARHSDLTNPAVAIPSLQKRPAGTVFVTVASRRPMPEPPYEAGSAQIFVEVDKRGRVDKASIEDADSEEIASAAMKNAKQCTYAPHVNDGRRVAFASLLVYVTPPLQPPPRK